MDLILKFGEWLISRSDPLLVVCLIVLAAWQRKTEQKIDKTDRKLEQHLNPDLKENPYPHPQCEHHESCFADLKQQLTDQHAETREDMQGLSVRIDRALERRCE